jgi:hypothetical protein
MNISDFMNKELPPEILEQLNVVGRVKFLLKPTVVSAVSEAEGSIPVDTDDDLKKVRDDVSNIIDDIVKFEDLVEQLEDAADGLMADMNIPSPNDQVTDAVKQLGGDGNITKPIFDKALSIIDYTPMLTTGQDPFLTALTGDGFIDGERLECSELGPNLGKKIKLAKRTNYTAETIIKDAGSEQKKKWDDMMWDMAIHLMNILIWKTMWPILVDHLLINSVRISIANPLDSIPGFFRKTPNRKYPVIDMWRIKTKDWLKAFGRANRLLNQLRWFLLCKLPLKLLGKKTGQKYLPEVDGLDCATNPECAQQGGLPVDSGFDQKVTFDQASDFMNKDPDPCIQDDDFPGTTPKVSTKFGITPECIQAAKVVVETVISDAFTPPISQINAYNDYKKGIK